MYDQHVLIIKPNGKVEYDTKKTVSSEYLQKESVLLGSKTIYLNSSRVADYLTRRIKSFQK